MTGSSPEAEPGSRSNPISSPNASTDTVSREQPAPQALDALLATVPAPVLAKLIDRRPWRVAQRTKLLGTDWRNYVALRVQS